MKELIIPRATEKAYTIEKQHTYVFFVPKAASKQAIAKMIADAFNVTVIDVRVANRKGKATRFSRGKHAYPGITYRQDHKVAYVKVKDGDKIPVFEDQNDKKSEKSEKDEKKAEKAAKKLEKKATKKAEKGEEK